MADVHPIQDDRMKPTYDELADAIRDLLQGGNHDGPCINYEDQDPAHYDGYEGCVRHIKAADQREERAAALLARLET